MSRLSFHVVCLLIKSLRPAQWIKNSVIFLPAFFAGRLLFSDQLWPLIFSFIIFSLLASSIYLFNDIWDREKDRIHPHKSQRPVASGQLSVQMIVITICILLITVYWAANIFFPELLLAITLYLLLNIAYTLMLKQIVVLDCMCIAIGFCLRLWAGSVVAQVELSMWIIMLTFFLALYLAFGKRLGDCNILSGSYSNVLYSRHHLRRILPSIAIILVFTYAIFTTRSQIESPYLYISTVFVILGVCRHLYQCLHKQLYSDPTHMLFTDRWMQLIIFLWSLFYAVILYI